MYVHTRSFDDSYFDLIQSWRVAPLNSTIFLSLVLSRYSHMEMLGVVVILIKLKDG